ncbi:MAG: hypothetical protein J1F71_03995, partial [Clostridiales bacterium]|nr:hypothetical protein [Clostridiales bacterium]
MSIGKANSKCINIGAAYFHHLATHTEKPTYARVRDGIAPQPAARLRLRRAASELRDKITYNIFLYYIFTTDLVFVALSFVALLIVAHYHIKKAAALSDSLLYGSGGGIRTSRPPGYEPDELP